MRCIIGRDCIQCKYGAGREKRLSCPYKETASPVFTVDHGAFEELFLEDEKGESQLYDWKVSDGDTIKAVYEISGDDKDGDVSDTLMVESVKPTADGTQAEVTYTAMDNSRNVTKKKLMVNYQASGETAPADSGQAPEGTEEGQESGEAGTEAPAPEGETTGEGTGEGEAAPADPSADPAAQEQPPQETAGGAEAAEAAIAQLPAGSPQFRLNEYEVTLPVGSKFDYSTYIQDITDDKDDRSTLFRQIQLQNPVDTNTPGTYEVVYYVVDSDGNQSNTAILKVNIQ